MGKGGGIAKEPEPSRKTTRLQLRLPAEILARIDAVRPRGIATPLRHD